MRAILPPQPLRLDEPKERLINQRRGLQRMAPTLPCDVAARQPPKLRLHEGQQLFERRLVAIAPRPQ